MRKIAAAIIVVLSCTSPDRARSTLESQGFTDIELTGYDAFSCGDGDDTCTGFRARGANGKLVRGAVGCGLACKGCTVRVKP